MKAKIKSKTEVAKETLEVQFDLLGETQSFKSGQYFYITLPSEPTRHLTIVNSPNQKEILTLATRLRDTAFKNSLKEMPIGSEVEIGNIEGDFVLSEDSAKPLVFVALGIGITPYVSMMRYIMEESLDFKVTLIFSDQDAKSMAYLSEFQAFEAKNPNFKMILTVTKDPAWQGENRHISGEFLKDYLENPKEYIYYISGPPKSVEGVTKSFVEAGIPKENIKSEDFSGY